MSSDRTRMGENVKVMSVKSGMCAASTAHVVRPAEAGHALQVADR